MQVASNRNQEVRPMSGLNKLMSRGIISPFVHGLLDYPLAAVLIVLPFLLDFDNGAARWIAVALGIGAAALAVGTAWQTGIVRVIPPLLHGYADLTVTVALIVLPFIVGFSSHTTALVFYLIVGIGGLLATLATRFEPSMKAVHRMMVREAA
jgi:hypothetical protein